MSDHASIQDRLLAAAAALGGGYWGLYPGECDYARRERWRSQASPKKARSVEDKLASLQADVENLTKRLDAALLDATKTKKDVEVVEALLTVALRELETLKREMKGGGCYGKSY